MSIDKYTSRGFGGSGASGRSSWSTQRESYKAPKDAGSNFLFGGSGLRGSPNPGAQHKSIPANGGPGLSSEATRFNDDHGSIGPGNDHSEIARKLDLRGGDHTTTKLQRIIILGGIFLAAVVCSMLIRAIAGDSSGASWVQERRAHINPDDEQ